MLSRKLTTRLNVTPLEDRAVPTTFPPLVGPTTRPTPIDLTPVPLTTTPIPLTPPAPIVRGLAVGYSASPHDWRVRLYQSPSQFQDFQAYQIPWFPRNATP